MPMTQDDIRTHYETEWKPSDDPALQGPGRYSSPVEDAVLYPIYEELIRDHRIAADGGRVLDVGCGSGRWLRFLLDRFAPRELVGIDFTAASIELLGRWRETLGDTGPTSIGLAVHDLSDAVTPPLGRFDFINVANVLFHIPENDKYGRALANLRELVAADGRIVTTEFLPRTRMRTEWMLVRSRYEFEATCRAADLRIVDIRPCSFFANDPMGLDGPDDAVRERFFQVRNGMQALLGTGNPEFTAFATTFLADVERAMLAYCRERLAPIDTPAQKLVLLAPA